MKVRFGIIGTSKISEWVLAGARQDSRYEAVAVYSRTQEKADDFAQRNGIPYTFTDLEAMAGSDLIDAVYIASPNFKHCEQAILCMSKGKHVLCEKPMASNAREAKAMIDASKKYGVALMEGMISTLNPNFWKVREFLPRLGTLRRYFASYCQYSSRYDKLKEGVVLNAFKPELSNGAMMDIGIYTVYPMVVLFGAPKQVSALGVKLYTGVDGQGAVNLEYEGLNATVLYSKIANSHLPTEIEGEDGNLLIDQIHVAHSVTFLPRQAAMSGRGPEAVKEDLSVPLEHDEYFYEIEEFINAIEAGKRESDINSHFNSLTTLQIIDEVRRQLGVVYPADKLVG